MKKIDLKNAKRKFLEKRKQKRNNKLLYQERKKHYKVVIEEENKRREEEQIVAPENCFISLRNINKIYDNYVQAVFDFNLDIKEKEFIVLVGPSGCGKSTTLRMISGLEEITTGDLFIDKELANELTPKERNIAMVFQSYALYPHMTVYENMAFGLMINKYPKEEIEERVKKAAKILELEDYLDRKPGALSGGQCQRVALGRAIVRNSKIFLLDEPLSNLDAKLRVAMRSEIVKLHNSLGATTIYVTHDQTEAMTMASRIVVMNKGYVQQVGTPSEIYEHPNNIFVATFIGSPAMNMLDGILNGNKIILSNGYTIDLNTDTKSSVMSFYHDEINRINKKIDNLKENYIKRNKDIFVKYQSILAKKGAELTFFKILNKFTGSTNFEVARSYATKILKGLFRNFDETYLLNINEDNFLNEFKNQYKDLYYKNQLEIDDSLKELVSNRNKMLEIIKNNDPISLKIGIRPESIKCFEADGEDGYIVTVSELLGSEYFLHFDFIEHGDFVAKVTTKDKIEAGAKLKIEIDKDMIHIFDPISQNAIC